MLDRIGYAGLAGIVLLLGGIGLIGYANPIIAAGTVLVLLGVTLILKGLVSNLLAAFGMGGGGLFG